MIEYEHGIPIPGTVQPRDAWTQTAFKHFPANEPLCWQLVFGRSAPVVLDLGCGNGRFTLHSALARPEFDHFGADALPLVIRYATRRANQRGFKNIRFAVKDAHVLVRDFCAAESVQEAHIYHPQPFHDRRLAHKRLLTPAFLADLWRCLRPGGLFVVQTDNPEYWNYLRVILPHYFSFQERRTPWDDAPKGRSRREILGRQRGLKIFRGEALKQHEISIDALQTLVDTLPLPEFRSRGPWLELDEIDESRP
jgi:tRNA (guanine-N7-)-methyltransferase